MLCEVFLLQGLLLLSIADVPKQPLISTSKGVIQGMLQDHSETTGVKFRAFLGIPYADKPIRFQLAKPKAPWKGILLTQKDGPACPQPTRLPTSEDCLYLNVFTPEDANPASKLPVMVYIHGSGFTYSSSYSLKYGPDFLIPKGVILVTFNFRLGILGFLTLGSKAAPGNLGLQDSLQALQWVQQEISQFGGDPGRMTLFGQSAGSVMTLFHYLSPISSGKGVFQRAIAQSGSALAPWAHYTREEGARRGYQLAQAVGCDTTLDDHCIVECLQAVDLQTLVNHTYIPLDDLVTGFFPFVPVLDDASWSDSPFFGESLGKLMKKAAKRSIPLISGFDAQDGDVAIDQTEKWRTASSQLISFIPASVREKLTKEEQACFAQEIKRHYFSESSDNNIKELISLFTDTFFAFPDVELSLYLKKLTYGYVFDYDGSWKIPNAYFSQFNLSGIVAHGAELPYLFAGKGEQVFDKTEENAPNLKVKDFMVELWTNFAKTGIPSHDWQPVSKGYFLLIDASPSKLPVAKIKTQYYDYWHNVFKEASSGRCRFCSDHNKLTDQ